MSHFAHRIVTSTIGRNFCLLRQMTSRKVGRVHEAYALGRVHG